MNKFLYRSIIVLPSGKLMVKYTDNPNIAETFGGVLTCRSRPEWPGFFGRISKQPGTTRTGSYHNKLCSPTSHPLVHPI